MAKMSPADQLCFSTVRIQCQKHTGEDSVGTGFFFGFSSPESGKRIPLIITNRHVIEDAEKWTFQLTEADSGGSPKVGTFLNITVSSAWLPHPDKDVDLCAMPIGPLLNSAKHIGHSFFFRLLPEDLVARSDTMSQLSAFEDVLMVGYPVGIWDSANNMPIFRKGVTATRPDLDYEGRREFLIDAACWAGSSGSPVLLFNVGVYSEKNGIPTMGKRIKLLGVLYKNVVFRAKGQIQVVPVPTRIMPSSITCIPTNLGLVIKAERILEFSEVVQEMVQPVPDIYSTD